MKTLGVIRSKGNINAANSIAESSEPLDIVIKCFKHRITISPAKAMLFTEPASGNSDCQVSKLSTLYAIPLTQSIWPMGDKTRHRPPGEGK